MSIYEFAGPLLVGISFATVLVGAQAACADDITNETDYDGPGPALSEATDFEGNFTNEAKLEATCNHAVLFQEKFTGNFKNTGDIDAAADGVHIDGKFDGNFTNNGNISGGSNGVRFNGAFKGNFNNSGNISGGSNGVRVKGAFKGNLTNSGNISGGGDHGLVVGSDFTGDLTNTGDISGAGSGHIHIGGDFTGNMTQPVGTEVRVDGTADLSGKTFTVHVDRPVAEGYSWNAIDAGIAVDLDDCTLTDNSLTVTFDDELSDNDTLNLTVSKPKER